MINGSLKDGIKYQSLVKPTGGTASTTLYNGSAVSVTANGFDCISYDECLFNVDTGTMYTGSTLDCAVVGADSDDPASAAVITKYKTDGTTDTTEFTQITESSDIAQGSLKTKNSTYRYLWLRSYQGSVTVNFSANVIAGKGDTLPVAPTLDWDIGY